MSPPSPRKRCARSDERKPPPDAAIRINHPQNRCSHRDQSIPVAPGEKCGLGEPHTAAIVGRVTDPSDAVIVGASVRAINAATGAVDAATTDDTGFYRIANLLPGEYFVEFEASGFQKTRLSA